MSVPMSTFTLDHIPVPISAPVHTSSQLLVPCPCICVYCTPQTPQNIGPDTEMYVGAVVELEVLGFEAGIWAGAGVDKDVG